MTSKKLGTGSVNRRKHHEFGEALEEYAPNVDNPLDLALFRVLGSMKVLSWQLI